MAVEIVERRKVSNGQRCVVARVDGDPKTDFPHTFDIKPGMTGADVQKELDFACLMASQLAAAGDLADSVVDAQIAAAMPLKASP
jgi:hypothetical protein